jgi:probable rRNA maturation factor
MKARRILSIQNRQRVRPIDTALLRQLTRILLDEHLRVPSHELGLHLVDAPEMARLNQSFLQHEGSTDVITFDHADIPPPTPHRAEDHQLHGEIFVSVPDALAQAEEFQTTWTSELLRYVIHGLLHLLGHDDRNPPARRAMKRAENRLLQFMEKTHPLHRLERRAPQRRPPTARSQTTSPTHSSVTNARRKHPLGKR